MRRENRHLAEKNISDDEVIGRLTKISCAAGRAISCSYFRILKNSTSYGYYKVFSDQTGQDSGYIIWAAVNRETVDKFMHTGMLPLYPYEWHEGEITMILDVITMNKYRQYTLMKIKNYLKQFTCLVYGYKNRRIYIDRTNRERSIVYKQMPMEL